MPTISATIITKNEEHNIKDCIESVLWVDEIIVADSGSTDKTKEICKQYAPKVKFYETDWPGFGKQKNRARELATSDWILSIDADERASKELENEIRQAIKSDQSVAYKISRLSYFKNKPITYCFSRYYEKPIMLTKKNCCTLSDDIVHESFSKIDGKTGELKNIVHHYTYESLEKMINKMNSYSSFNADKLYKKGKRTNISMILIRSLWTFIKIYFLKLVFLNGWPGFLIALANAEGTFYKYAKLLEKERDKK